MNNKITCMALLCITAVALAGCPWDSLEPPFDTSGKHLGVWIVGPSSEDAEGCLLRLDLEQDVAAGPIRSSRVTGTGEMGLECMGEIGLLLQELGLLENLLFKVEGAITPDGNLMLSTADLLGECTGTLCISAVFTGKAEDWDADGFMDFYEGTWIGAFQLGALPTEATAALNGIPAALPGGGDFRVWEVPEQ